MNQTFLPPPILSGTGDAKVLQLHSYLFQMAEQLNLALQSLDTGNFTEETAKAIQAGTAAEKTSKDLPQQYQNLKALVIKTADTVQAEMDALTATLEGSYVAQSDFGTYVQQLSAYIEANPESITQYYSFASDLQANIDAVDAAFSQYETETEAYIRTGIVYYEGAVPIYGVAVGQNLSAETVDGEAVIEQKDFRATFTAKKLSFWQDETEVAYVSNNTLYIREVHILESIHVGSWQISTSNGFAVKWIGS